MGSRAWSGRRTEWQRQIRECNFLSRALVAVHGAAGDRRHYVRRPPADRPPDLASHSAAPGQVPVLQFHQAPDHHPLRRRTDRLCHRRARPRGRLAHGEARQAAPADQRRGQERSRQHLPGPGPVLVQRPAPHLLHRSHGRRVLEGDDRTHQRVQDQRRSSWTNARTSTRAGSPVSSPNTDRTTTLPNRPSSRSS